MHMYKDDFGAVMLQTASDFFRDEKYREGTLKYATWLSEHQDEDGGLKVGMRAC